MLYQGNVFSWRQPGGAECGEISAGIWGATQTLSVVWRELAKQDVGSSSVWCFCVRVCVCVRVHSTMRDYMSACTFPYERVRVCVSSLWLSEPERRKCFWRDSPQSASDGWGQLRNREEWCVLCLLKTTFMLWPKLRKNATAHVRKTQISRGWSACVNRAQAPPKMKTQKCGKTKKNRWNVR